MALKIDPCPFCGSTHLHLVMHASTYSISCQTCRCRGPQKHNQETAIVHWNKTKPQIGSAAHSDLTCDRPLSALTTINLAT